MYCTSHASLKRGSDKRETMTECMAAHLYDPFPTHNDFLFINSFSASLFKIFEISTEFKPSLIILERCCILITGFV